jgi:hypothetical protein
MNVYVCTLSRTNYTISPSMKQSIDIIFTSEHELDTKGNPYHDIVSGDMWKAAKEQAGFLYEKFELAVDGFGGWSSVTADTIRFIDVYDRKFDFGVVGEGRARIAETFEELDTSAYSGKRSYRVTGFYKITRERIKEGTDYLEVYIMPSSREEADYVSGAGVAGCIKHIDKVTTTGIVGWDDRAIQKTRDDYDESMKREQCPWMDGVWLRKERKSS